MLQSYLVLQAATGAHRQVFGRTSGAAAAGLAGQDPNSTPQKGAAHPTQLVKVKGDVIDLTAVAPKRSSVQSMPAGKHDHNTAVLLKQHCDVQRPPPQGRSSALCAQQMQ